MSYWLNITDDDGNLLDRISLDGLNLRRDSDRRALGEMVESGMGSRHVDFCATLPPPYLTEKDG